MSWSLVALGTAIIFLTIPFARQIQVFAESIVGSQRYLILSATLGVLFGLFMLAYILRRRKTRIPLRVLWMLILGAGSAWVMKNQLQKPAEAIHFFQYGLLSLLLFRAWSHHVRNWLIYPTVTLSIVLVASADEFLQWLMPGRYWDFRDIRLNLMAGIIIQVFIALVISPSAICEKVTPRSVRRVCRMAWLALFLFGVAISNTPARVDIYATRIPFLYFLSDNESVMNEFGYRHVDPEIGVFFSRFPTSELRRIDRDRGTEAGEVIRRYRAFADYREFLQNFRSGIDPFLHEMRVHLHRRDHYYDAGFKYQESDPERFILHMTTALRENQLLEKYFPATLEAAESRWDEEKLLMVLPHADLARSYISPVSDHLVTAATEFELWIVLLGAGLIIVWIYYKYGRARPAGGG